MQKLKFLSKLKLVFLLIFFSLNLSAQQDVLNFSDTWVRQMPPGAPTLAAYMTITNASETEIKIMGVSSSVSKRAELHEVSMENDLMKMQQLTDLVILPGQSIEFKQGAMHIMLVGVTESLREGDDVEIEFELENQTPVRIIVPVKKDA